MMRPSIIRSTTIDDDLEGLPEFTPHAGRALARREPLRAPLHVLTQHLSCQSVEILLKGNFLPAPVGNIQ
jgi:hypothetical protein